MRIKLPAFVEDKALSTKVKSREKDLKNKKYNVVNWTLYRFKIDKVLPSPIKTQKQFKDIKNSIPEGELDQLIREKYTLLKEDFANKKYNPYQLIGKNGGVYTPFFYASDLQLVPKDSTGFSIYPSTANVEKLNSMIS